jgi:hypothetical protein
MSLESITDKLRIAFTAHGVREMWRVAAEFAGEWVEIRHIPAAPAIDGWRDADRFRGYMEEENRVMPLAFIENTVEASFSTADDAVVINPFIRSGRLITPGNRTVRLISRIELKFDNDRLTAVLGVRSRETLREDALSWLEAINSVGGFNPPPPHSTRVV